MALDDRRPEHLSELDACSAAVRERDVDSLTNALASLHVAQLRENNGRLQERAVSAGAACAALRAELDERAAQAHELGRLQEQLAGLVPAPPAPAAPAARQASAGEKRRSSAAAGEVLAWRAELGSEVGSTSASASDDEPELLLNCARDEPEGEPDWLEAHPGWLDSVSVHDELRHELRTRTHLESEVARANDEYTRLRARINNNDAVITRLEALNSSLVLHLQAARDASRHELNAKRGRRSDGHSVTATDHSGEHVECF
mmetsp:Transcript_26774/g.67828  ORF Transcript_26774/g.67828 Transcript_26774/m.67828 type:complete len:260 (+) Transcript_26774:174-953(+)